MKAYELEEMLRQGHYIIAAFGSVSLWKGTERVKTVHPNIFRALLKDGVLHEKPIECGAARFTLRNDEPNINWQERADKAEALLERIRQVAIHNNEGNAIIPSSMILEKGDE